MTRGISSGGSPMSSPKLAADLERVLSRAAQECESKHGVWFGDGLPQALQTALEAHGKKTTQEPAEIAFVEVSTVSPQGRATSDADPSTLGCPVVGVSMSTLDDLGSLVRPHDVNGIQISLLICPIAVFDFTSNGLRVREVRHGLTAADLQQKLSTTLWSSPDLKELGTH
jgi:acyl CoA:acetate/3-ketoacid CoA transferase beta subunit